MMPGGQCFSHDLFVPSACCSLSIQTGKTESPVSPNHNIKTGLPGSTVGLFVFIQIALGPSWWELAGQILETIKIDLKNSLIKNLFHKAVKNKLSLYLDSRSICLIVFIKKS